jgi:SNF2 family DNA or RNA helicase
MIFNPHEYQKKAIAYIIEHEKCGLFLDMGLGKTVITLTAIEDLMYNQFEIEKVLVIAPLRVAESTWSTECEKWEHLRHLKISKILGTPTQRRLALYSNADIYIINRENVPWLCNELSNDAWAFDMVAIDELSSFKNPSSQRFKHLRKYIFKSNRVVGLTGTPSPNGLIDLWSQIYLLDGGVRLGKTITSYRQNYFLPDKCNAQVIYSYKPKENTDNLIHQAISDICLSMSAKDYLTLPQRIDNIMPVYLSEKEKLQYDEFEKNSYLEFINGEITALSKASLINKLLQFSNGAVYSDDGYIEVSDKKIKALQEIMDISQGQPILCFYSYKHDVERIQKVIPDAKVLKSNDDIQSWNRGEISLLLVHPASAGFGLNLQHGGHIIVWFGLTWSLEQYQQANARLYRQGQTQSVIIHHLITQGSVEHRVMDSLQGKKDVQDDLLSALKLKYERNKIS